MANGACEFSRFAWLTVVPRRTQTRRHPMQTLIQWGISTTSNARLFGLYESTSQTTSRSVQPFCRAHDRDQQTCHTVQRRTDHGMSVHARRNSTAHWRCGLMVFMAFSLSYSDCMSSRGSFDGRRLSAG